MTARDARCANVLPWALMTKMRALQLCCFAVTLVACAPGENTADGGDARSMNTSDSSSSLPDASSAMDSATSAPDATMPGNDAAAVDTGVSSRDAASSSDAASSTDAAAPMPSAGCGTARAPGYTCSTITIGAMARSYCVMVPTGYNPTRANRVRYSLHGCGGSINMSGTASNSPFIMVYPKSEGSCWDGSTAGRDAMFIQAIEAELERTLCVDRSRIFADGYSSGGFMATTLACARFAGIRAAATAGGASNCARPMPVWQYHGTADTTVPFMMYGPPVRDGFVRANGCSMSTMPVPNASACVEYQGCRERTIWCSDAGGHRWPSWGPAAASEFFMSF